MWKWERLLATIGLAKMMWLIRIQWAGLMGRQSHATAGTMETHAFGKYLTSPAPLSAIGVTLIKNVSPYSVPNEIPRRLTIWQVASGCPATVSSAAHTTPPVTDRYPNTVSIIRLQFDMGTWWTPQLVLMTPFSKKWIDTDDPTGGHHDDCWCARRLADAALPTTITHAAQVQVKQL